MGTLLALTAYEANVLYQGAAAMEVKRDRLAVSARLVEKLGDLRDPPTSDAPEDMLGAPGEQVRRFTKSVGVSTLELAELEQCKAVVDWYQEKGVRGRHASVVLSLEEKVAAAIAAHKEAEKTAKERAAKRAAGKGAA